eukprot:7238134-Alexandrium_andersonii.AAC.1
MEDARHLQVGLSHQGQYGVSLRQRQEVNTGALNAGHELLAPTTRMERTARQSCRLPPLLAQEQHQLKL